jgi:hypothetical protein
MLLVHLELNPLKSWLTAKLLRGLASTVVLDSELHRLMTMFMVYQLWKLCISQKAGAAVGQLVDWLWVRQTRDRSLSSGRVKNFHISLSSKPALSYLSFYLYLTEYTLHLHYKHHLVSANREIITVCFKNRTKLLNTLCGQNAACLHNVKVVN